MIKEKKNRLWGYLAGIISGITYGMNPLFGVPILNQGVGVGSLLFYRYIVAISVMALWIVIKGDRFCVSRRQLGVLVILGTLFTLCSLLLFAAYRRIPSGIATTIIYIYPIIVALMMVLLKVYPTWQTWISIIIGFVGVVFLTITREGNFFDWLGIILVLASACSYATFIVVVNRSKAISTLSNTVLTFYCFLIGTIILFAYVRFGTQLDPLPHPSSWFNIIGLAILPTTIATITLASSSKIIGPTQASVLGIFEPLTAIFIGTMIFHEPFTIYTASGIGLTLFAIIFMILSSNKKNTL